MMKWLKKWLCPSAIFLNIKYWVQRLSCPPRKMAEFIQEQRIEVYVSYFYMTLKHHEVFRLSIFEGVGGRGEGGGDLLIVY